MASTVQGTAQAIFKRIVVHNKLMDEATAERFLAREPDPEKIIRYLVQQKKIKPELGQQLLTLYQRQLEKAGEVSGGIENGSSAAAPAASAPSKQSEDDFFAALVDEVADSPSEGQASPEASLDVSPIDAGDSRLPLTGAAAAQTPGISPRDELPMLALDTDDDEEPPAPVARPAAKAAPAPAAPPSEAPAAVAAVAHSTVAPTRDKYSPLIIGLLKAAREANASDIHVKSGEIPLVRIAGTLRELENTPVLKAADVEAGLLTIVSDAQREKFLATNDLDFCFDGGLEMGRYRTNFMRQHRGMDGIFRLISAKVPSFDELKLPPMVKKFTEYKQGIVLVTGPKGCGKTTTLAAMVDLINSTRSEHIITIEDPIEFVHPCKMGHVNQREVGSHTESFSNALRAALREAPDVIMVGEMRDLETTSLAITAAETGHLVFATLHTPDAIRTIDRVLDVFPPKEQGQIRSMISESMRGIISQLLLPSVDGKHQELAVEILVNTTAIGNLIREEKTFQLRGIMQTGRRLGMQLMDDSLMELARAGRITKEEAVDVATETVRVRKELGI